MIAVKPPFLGVAYYPEDWNVSEIDKDIEKIINENEIHKFEIEDLITASKVSITSKLWLSLTAPICKI